MKVSGLFQDFINGGGLLQWNQKGQLGNNRKKNKIKLQAHNKRITYKNQHLVWRIAYKNKLKFNHQWTETIEGSYEMFINSLDVELNQTVGMHTTTTTTTKAWR